MMMMWVVRICQSDCFSWNRGRIEVFSTGPDGVGLFYMERQADQIDAILAPYLESGEITSVFTIVGRYDPNRIGITATLAQSVMLVPRCSWSLKMEIASCCKSSSSTRLPPLQA